MLTVRTLSILGALASSFVLTSAAHAQFGILPGSGVRFSTVAMGDQAQIDRPGLYRFLDDASLRNHWAKYRLGGQYPPKIDWTADQVIVLHLGTRSTGGYGINLGSLEKAMNGVVKILAVETTPPKGMMTTQALTSPYLVLAIDRMIPGFELTWTKAPLGGFTSVPKGSTILSSPGNVTVITPLSGPCGVWGGDYFSLCDAARTGWISSDLELGRYNQFTLGDPYAIAPGFDWSSERLFAVHLGTRTTPVGIRMVGFEQRGTRGILRLTEVPARGYRPRTGIPVSPFLLTRVSREVQRVDVEWVKPSRGDGNTNGSGTKGSGTNGSGKSGG